MRRIDRYKVQRDKTDLGDPNFWNFIFEDIDLRLHLREQDAAKIDAAVEVLTAVALQRLNDTFTPLILSAQEQLENLGAKFQGESASEIALGLGEKTFVLTEATRPSYVVPDYAIIRPAGDAVNGLVVQVTGYDRDTGLLDVDVLQVFGAGTFDSWIIKASPPPDLTHAGNTENPHETTAAQVGAYSIAAADAAIAAAITALKDGVGGTRDTLKKLSDAVDGALAATAAILGPTPPAALDTVRELAAALQDNASIVTDLTTLIGTKAPINSPTFTGVPAGPTAAPGTNTTQFATCAFVAAAIAAASAFPSGTLMLFQQSAAPTGWTKQTTHNDKALRIVSGNVSTGGSLAFSTCFARTATDNHTLTIGSIPPHDHSAGNFYDSNGTGWGSGNTGDTDRGSKVTGTNGGGGAHSHGCDMRVAYVDIIIAAKN